MLPTTNLTKKHNQTNQTIIIINIIIIRRIIIISETKLQEDNINIGFGADSDTAESWWCWSARILIHRGVIATVSNNNNNHNPTENNYVVFNCGKGTWSWLV